VLLLLACLGPALLLLLLLLLQVAACLVQPAGVTAEGTGCP
jgi:hypothetical protein